MNQTMHVSLAIPPGCEDEVARQCRALASNQDWQRMVRFALAVVILEEERATGREVLHWVAPAPVR